MPKSVKEQGERKVTVRADWVSRASVIWFRVKLKTINFVSSITPSNQPGS